MLWLQTTRPLFCDRSQRDRYRRRFQYYCDIADVAASFLPYEIQEFNDSGYDVLACFADAEKEHHHVSEQHHDTNGALEAWKADVSSAF